VDLKAVFANINQSLAISRDVKISDVTLTLDPLTADEEFKVLEACKDYEGSQYLAGFKRHTVAMAIRKANGEAIDALVNYTGDDGKVQSTTRYLYFLKMIEDWSSSLQDLLYDAYADMLAELDAKIAEKASFKRFVVARSSEDIEKEIDKAPEGFQKVTEADADMNDGIEKFNRLVAKEAEAAQAGMARTEQEAVSGKK
jgi:hypothetical protein